MILTLFRYLKLTGTLVPVTITHLVVTVPMIAWVIVFIQRDIVTGLAAGAIKG